LKCVKEISTISAVEGVDHVGRKGFKKFRGNFELVFGKPHRPLVFSVRWQRADFRNRDVPLAKKNRLSAGQLCKVTGQMSLGFVDI
jgi:hypothetical protein